MIHALRQGNLGISLLIKWIIIPPAKIKSNNKKKKENDLNDALIEVNKKSALFY